MLGFSWVAGGLVKCIGEVAVKILAHAVANHSLNPVGVDSDSNHVANITKAGKATVAVAEVFEKNFTA
jgi:hypothetical protein